MVGKSDGPEALAAEDWDADPRYLAGVAYEVVTQYTRALHEDEAKLQKKEQELEAVPQGAGDWHCFAATLAVQAAKRYVEKDKQAIKEAQEMERQFKKAARWTSKLLKMLRRWSGNSRKQRSGLGWSVHM